VEGKVKVLVPRRESKKEEENRKKDSDASLSCGANNKTLVATGIKLQIQKRKEKKEISF
jgi:hypothetical protein